MHTLSGQTIVFLPGMDGTGISFEPFAEVLPPDVKTEIIRYPTDKLLSFDETVQWAGDRIQCSDNAIVIAESFSGPVAIALVASGRIRPKCLILCSTFARSPRPALIKVLKLLPLTLVLQLPFPRFLFRHIIEGGEKTTDLFLALWNRIRVLVPPKVLVHRLTIIDAIDIRRLLQNIDVPCLYIQARSDRSVPASCLDDFFDAMPALAVKRIQGPHFILQARPLECLDAVNEFLEKTAAFRH